MLKGVIVLSEELVSTSYAFTWNWFGIVIIVIAIITGCFSREKFLIKISCVLMVFSIPFFIVESNYKPQYKVIIDDSVSMAEFDDKYEIIDKEGKIYTIREREDNQE